MSTLSVGVAPMAPRGFITKASAFAAGTAFAGAALLGGTAVAPTVTTSLAASVHHDYVLTADPTTGFPTFTESLQTLLTAVGFGNMGQVLGIFGDGINTSSELSVLLAALNPDGMSLDDATLGLLSTDITALLNDVQMPAGGGTTVPLGDMPIDALLGGFIGGTGASESIGAVLTALGFGDYVGLLDLPFLNLSPTQSVATILENLLGIDSTMSINDLLDANGMQDATIASLFGIDSDQLAGDWNLFVDNLVLGGTIMDPEGTGHLGDMTLGALLTSLLPSGSDPVTDATTLTDFLGGLDVFGMLGLT